MSVQLLAMALAPLLGLFIISIGNGMLASLTTLRLDTMGQSATMVGIVSSAYFIGLTLGSIFNDRLIVRIGHIRAYSCFAALIATSILFQGMSSEPWTWFVLRLVNGWASVGVFLVVESWLLMAADPKIRGRLLALYMIALYGAGLLGQVNLGAIALTGDTVPFMIAAILASLSLLPIVMLPRATPIVERAEPLMPLQLLRATPTGVIGCFGSGIAIAAVYALLPLYLQRIGMDVTEVGHMMAWVILGAMLLQYPVGRWSDHQDRHLVLIVLGAACALLSLVILMLPAGSPLLVVAFFLLGGGIFAIYPVAVSHAADRASSGAIVSMIQGLLLINSLGCAISPLVISPLMTRVGEAGLFWALAALNVGLVLLFAWRRAKGSEPVTAAPFTAAAQMSAVGVEMRVTEDLAQAVLEHEREVDIGVADELAVATGTGKP
ncbi:MFS transporter [Pseudomonas fragi]|uniref:MFS transporter n=1 Tax=Pseudomonas fragi TaxID=296 RepID=UPI001F44B4C2|nr:MFS transporter [Pseudomonas fragi]MCF6762608.1 MFS transporter [Pseudomonas fragi]